MTEAQGKVDAIVLAGAPASDGALTGEVHASRAMIELEGKTMLQWVVNALGASSSVGKILAVGDVSADGVDSVVEPGDSLVENIRRGIDALKTDAPVLVVSSDIPLLTSEAVDDFVDRASRLDADMAYPIIPRAHCEARYPGLKRTYLVTGDGVFTGGNMMLVRPDFVERSWNVVMDAYSARKHVARLARMIGLGVLARVLVARLFPSVLRIPMLEQAASRMLGAKVAAVVSAYPEIGEDVDKPSDLAAVREILASASGK